MAPTSYLTRRQSPYRDPQDGGAVCWEKRSDDAGSFDLQLGDYDVKWDTVTAVDVSGVAISSISLTAAGLLTVVLASGVGSATARCVSEVPAGVLLVPMVWRSPDAGSSDAWS